MASRRSSFSVTSGPSSCLLEFPPIRACIFDLDGLLINSEDVITGCTNDVLSRYGRPPVTREMRVKLIGVANSTSSDVFHEWAALPIPREQWAQELREQMHSQFPSCKPLPGAAVILANLSRAVNAAGDRLEMGLASSTKTASYYLKTSEPEVSMLLDMIPAEQRVLGDDLRIRERRGKPAPDIYLLVLQVLNSAVAKQPDRQPIMPEECLVFEDSVAGVEAGRRAGMRVVWVPHPDVAIEYDAKEKDILAGGSGMLGSHDDSQQGESNGGWAERISGLGDFDYGKYGLAIL